MRSVNVATSLELKNQVLASIRVPQDIKAKLWRLATETEGCLVQKVSRSVVAVKCQVSPKHPLGYLHFTFACSKGRYTYDKYYCSCTEHIGLFLVIMKLILNDFILGITSYKSNIRM